MAGDGCGRCRRCSVQTLEGMSAVRECLQAQALRVQMLAVSQAGMSEVQVWQVRNVCWCRCCRCG